MTDLARNARHAVAWSTGLYALRDLVQFGLMLVLVRLLPLEAYGQFGLLNTIIGFMMVYSSREFVAHTLLVRDESDLNYQEQFTAGCVIQVFLFVAANIAALAFRWLPIYAPVATPLHILSLTFLFDLPAQIRTRMLERSLNWRRLRTIEAIGITAGTVMSLVFGLAGAGIYALILPSFVLSLAFLIDLFVVEGWRPHFGWNLQRYRASMHFGMKRVVSQTFVSASNLLESGLLARMVGYTALGIFGRAMSMATLFCQRVASLLMGALYPVLARIPRASDSYRRVSALVLRTVVWTVVPSATIISLLAEPVVNTLYGSRWTEAIPLVPWAMTVGACLATGEASYGLLLAHHEPRRCLYVDVFRLAGVAAAIALAMPLGLRAYVAALAVVFSTQVAAMLYWLHQSEAVTITGITRAFVPASICAGAGGLGAELTQRALTQGGVPEVPLLASCGVVFVVVYIGLLRLLFAELLFEIVGYLPRGASVNRLLGFAPAA